MYFVSSCVAIDSMWATQQMNQFILVSISYPACIELGKKQVKPVWATQVNNHIGFTAKV